MNVRQLTRGLLWATGFFLWAGVGAIAAEPPSAPNAAKPKLDLRPVLLKQEGNTDAKQADADEKSDDEPKVDRFAVPEGGAKELLEFLQETMKFRPKTRAEMVQFQVRGKPAMKEAAEKLQQIATDEDKKLPGYADVEAYLLLLRAEDRNASDEDKAKLLDDLKAYFAGQPEPSKYAVAAGRMLASALEYGGSPQEAIVVYRELGSLLAKNADATVAKTGAQMEGAARRLGLVGQPLEISGTEMDGTKFDWAKYRGKVVLVDFWATWCGPCLAELPNVKQNYELYHDKGFEVVGISLDRDRAALEKFLADEQNPWVTLYDGDWSDNAVATYYGVMGIPTVLLVDKEGNVLSTRARGPELGKLLAEQLGPAEPAAEEEKKSEADAKTE